MKYRVKRMLGTTTQKVTLWAVMATADRATCNTRAHAPLIDQAVGILVSSLLKQLGERDQHQT